MRKLVETQYIRRHLPFAHGKSGLHRPARQATVWQNQSSYRHITTKSVVENERERESTQGDSYC